MNDPANKPIDPNLLTRFLSGDASANESEQLQEWIRASEQNKTHFEQLSLLWEKSAAIKQEHVIDTKKDWQQLKAKINFTKAGKESKAIPKQRSLLYQLIKVAAMLILTIGIGWLANRLTRSAEPADTIIVSAHTQSLPLTLPDGTKVFLNKNAILTYPENFGERIREVQLRGEAFFEVVKNPQKPFLITSGNTTTQVLGTSFNVYENGQNVVVSVVTGKVALYESAHQDKKLTMIAGEQGNYQHGELSKAINQNPNFLSWKTGVLTFKNTPLLQVFHDLNKHYQQHLVVGNQELEACTLTSTFNKKTFGEVLEELQLVLPVSVFREGEGIIISGGGCSDQ